MVVRHPVDERMAQRFIDYDYHDRGMLKWQGFMLSDHSAYIERAKRGNEIKKLPAQPAALIRTLIQTALTKQLVVIIQPNYIELNQPIEVTGQIKGAQAGDLYLKTKKGIETMPIDAICNLRFTDRDLN